MDNNRFRLMRSLFITEQQIFQNFIIHDTFQLIHHNLLHFFLNTTVILT